MDIHELALLPAEQLLAALPSALLLVDCENRFACTKMPDGSYQAHPVVQPISQLLSSARRQDIPRFYVTVATHHNGAYEGTNDTAPWLRRISDISGATRPEQLGNHYQPSDHDIVEVLAPQPGEVWLFKQRFSAFYETGLEVALRAAGVEVVVVVGVASYGCIYTTCLDATFRGFFALVPRDATYGEDPELHAAAMSLIGKQNIVDSDTVQRAWGARESTLSPVAH